MSDPTGLRIAFGADDTNECVAAVRARLAERAELVPVSADLAWPSMARTVGELVAGGGADLGVLMCWTGTGTAIAANKVRGVRAAQASDPWIARGARLWNDANVLTLSLKQLAPELAVACVDAFLDTTTPDPDEAAAIALLRSIDEDRDPEVTTGGDRGDAAWGKVAGVTGAVEVEDLHKSYGDVDAVRGVSFTVAAGEIVAVLGPNGAGKTTTIEMLEGFRTPTSGTVRVLDTDPATGGSDFRARIGIVLQETGIDPYLSVEEVLRMHASYYPAPRGVDETIELVGLAEKRDARVKTLSGGQQRRLDVGLGIIGDPELLFLDEPTTGFDPSARRQAWDVVHRLRDLGKTVLLTTHYMEEAQALADRLVVIAAGRIIAEGTPDAIGGRANARSVIRFPWPADRPLADLPVITTRDGGAAVVETAEVTSTLRSLTDWAVTNGVDLDALTVTRPSLEDVYLELVGGDA